MDIALFGLSKAGKTSIVRVIFNKVNPQQTVMLESAQKVESMRVTLGEHINFSIHDFPGSYNFSDPSPPEICQIEQCGSMIFVLDVQDEPYNEAYSMFIKALDFVKSHHEKCQVNFFIHKVDQDMFQQEDKRNELLQSIKERVDEEIENYKLKDDDINIQYFMTTIYDQSLLEAYSKVVQRILPQQQQIKSILDQLVNMCKMEKAFLFEVISKLCISTDQNIVDLQNFTMCSEMIDVFIDISFIYGQKEHSMNNNEQQQQSSAMIKLTDGTMLMLREVEKYIVLITIIKEENNDRPFLIDYNIDVFKKGLKKLFEIKQ